MSCKNISELQQLLAQKTSLAELRKIFKDENIFIAPEDNEPARRQHSEILDQLLGFQIKKIEQKLVVQGKIKNPYGNYKTWGPELHQGVQSWVGLDPRTLQTPYTTLLEILKTLELKAGQKFIDFGAAYGRAGILIGFLYPQVFFQGFEIVLERVDETKRVYQNFYLKNSQMEQSNVAAAHFECPEADAYFIYDYGQEKHIKHTLEQLKILSKKRMVQIVVRGNLIKHCLMDYPEFELINENLGIYKIEAT